jgi:hypothetical protein
MKFLDLLAKLGILRYGATKATYTSGADRPAEMMMPGVFDAKRDLVSGGDREKDAPADPRKPPPAK